MRTSDKNSLVATVIAGAICGGFAYATSDTLTLPWWVWPIGFLVLAGGGVSQLNQESAMKNLADKEMKDRP